MKYQVYSAYKVSGVEWLGEVPAHWSVEKLKYTSGINKNTLRETTEPTYHFNYVDIGNVQECKGIVQKESMTFQNAPSRARRIVKKGDVIVSTVRTYLKAIAPIRDDDDTIVSTGFCVVTPKDKLHSEYAGYLLRSSYFVEKVVSISVGVSYPATNASDIANIKLPLPTYSEQQQIATFLDKETTQIDTLIEKQQKLIELLKEKRQALISHAVTKGLNPNVPLKESGVEWLGEVPAHWEVKRYKNVTRRIDVGIAEAATHAYVDKGIPILRSTNVGENYLKLDNILYIFEEFAIKNQNKFLYENDIVTVRTGYPGRSAVIPKELDMSHCFTLLIATPNETVVSEFLCYALNSEIGKKYFDLQSWGTAQKNISVPILQNFFIAIAPLYEQLAIVEYLKDKCGKLDSLIKKASQAIALLKERRTALISAAVTGKIDVRHK